MPPTAPKARVVRKREGRERKSNAVVTTSEATEDRRRTIVLEANADTPARQSDRRECEVQRRRDDERSDGSDALMAPPRGAAVREFLYSTTARWRCAVRELWMSRRSTTPPSSILPLLDFVQPRLQRLNVVRIDGR
jgi:hypothetical protein